MEQFTFLIRDALGIHARPAGLLAKTLKPFSCRVTLTAGSRSTDARRVFDVMELGIHKGQSVTFTLDGPDETAASETLKRFCENTL